MFRTAPQGNHSGVGVFDQHIQQQLQAVCPLRCLSNRFAYTACPLHTGKPVAGVPVWVGLRIKAGKDPLRRMASGPDLLNNLPPKVRQGQRPGKSGTAPTPLHVGLEQRGGHRVVEGTIGVLGDHIPGDVYTRLPGSVQLLQRLGHGGTNQTVVGRGDVVAVLYVADMDADAALPSQVQKFPQTVQEALSMAIIGVAAAAGVSSDDAAPGSHQLHQAQQFLPPGKEARLIVQAQTQSQRAAIHGLAEGALHGGDLRLSGVPVIVGAHGLQTDLGLPGHHSQVGTQPHSAQMLQELAISSPVQLLTVGLGKGLPQPLGGNEIGVVWVNTPRRLRHDLGECLFLWEHVEPTMLYWGDPQAAMSGKFRGNALAQRALHIGVHGGGAIGMGVHVDKSRGNQFPCGIHHLGSLRGGEVRAHGVYYAVPDAHIGLEGRGAGPVYHSPAPNQSPCHGGPPVRPARRCG